MVKKILKNKELVLLIILAILFSVTSIALTFGALQRNNTISSTSQGIIEDTVYINDLDSDYYYYTGQNYTTSTTEALPSLDDKNLYNDTNLVMVTITYDGSDYNTKETGYVSLNENQSKFIYYKYYPIVDDYIEIELIDNPFNDHPNDRVFNGWITDYEGATISYDETYYTRSVKVPVTYTDNMPNNIEITMHANWTAGKVGYVSGSFNSAFNSLSNEGMNEIITATDVYEDPSVAGYYKAETITTVTTITQGGLWYDSETEYGTCTDCYDNRGNYYQENNEYTCSAPSVGFWPSTGETFTNECTIYRLQDENDEYDPSSTYYELNRGQMTDANLEPIYVGSESNGLFDENSNMAGYFRSVNVNYRDSIDNLYNETGTMQSGTCTNRNGCTYYELIQFYKDDGTEELFNINENYYYMTTRDTNILVMTGNTSSTWSSSNNKPFTLTGIYNDVDYNATWTVSNSSVICYNDTRIEELTIATNTRNSNTDPTNSSNTRGVFYGNYQNAKIGRNIKQSGNYVNFISIIGGMNSTSGWGSSTVGSASNPQKYKLVVESGNYNSSTLMYGASTSTRSTQVYAEMYGIYGNDYDRATKNNDNLVVYYCAAGSWSGRIHSSDDALIPSLNTIVKSGSFGTSHEDLTTGIYVGGRTGGTMYAPRTIKVEGGYIFNLNGGPITADTKDDENDIYIYMTGGEIDFVVGGAGTSETYGNRIIQITGGTVNYSVFGGSNGNDGDSTDGTLYGSTYVYIGGKAIIGNEEYVNNGYALWDAEAGSVFGAGNGNTRYATIGSVNNSNIIINDEALIRKNVYGSGNYGTVGYSTNSQTTNTNIKIIGGKINGSVFGSGNNSGSGRNNRITASINITMDNGVVLNAIHGGSNQEGTIYGSVNITLNGGSTKDVYGGGLGSETYVSENINVKTTSDNLIVTGSIYGGSSLGVVNLTNKTTTQSNYNVLVDINGGTIENVFGGGKGNDNNTPYVGGNVTVNINNGNITSVFGGNDASGEPNGEVVVNLNGGVINNVYGGGNNTLVTNTHVYQNNSEVSNLFGGSNASGNVTTSEIIVEGGNTTNLYGGNNIGGQTATTNITVNNGNITTMYGGGKLTTTGITNILINNGTINTTYGGGESASIVTDTNITIQNGNLTEVYGGSNIIGDVPSSNIAVNGGTINSLYGGNNKGGITTTTYVNLNSGQITNVYGGGNQTTTTTSNITLKGSTVENIYGGGNQAGIDETNIDLITGNATNVFGGSNTSGTVTTSNINSNNPNNLQITNLYGGNNQGGITEDANINLQGGTYTNIYGGGNRAITNKTVVNVDSIHMNGDFYGGGNEACVNTNTNVTIKNSDVAKDLFGGGNLGSVIGNTNVYISNTRIDGSAYAGGNGTSATVYGNTSLKIDNNTLINKHVFGGGNAANTGTKEEDSSLSNVEIAGAIIHGNVYGGANTAVLYGVSNVKIGAKVTDLTRSNIIIDGTVFGGGEANASGDEDYDYSFISVTKGINIDIDGENYSTFTISGSIFGSGNASSTEGYSYIDISNYGTFENYQKNISIQRADIVTIKNSAIKLEGTTDRTNEYSTVKFSISRVKELKLANNSTLFLENGTNLLEKFSSLKIDDTEEKATVTINEDGSLTRNVNNRIYMLEGKNLNIATNEAVTAYGGVNGMTFFGMYQLDRNGDIVTAFFDNKYEPGDTVASGEFYTFTSGSYALGLHYTNHNIEEDGFYSNYENENNPGTIEAKYIEPTPNDASYYMWVIGESVTTYELSLTASRYATLGTYELPLVGSSGANTEYQILGFNYQNLEEDFILADEKEIDRINNDGTADTKMALTMEASNSGLVTIGQTNFMTDENTPVTGTTSYKSENSSAVPSFIFYLYHSKNLSLEREIGTVVISMIAITPIDDLNNEITRININVTLNSALYSDDVYEGAMTSGEKYDLFASTATNITNKSTLSAYYSLYMETNTNYYKTGYHHTLVSSYVFPEKTKITMIDLGGDAPIYYYHVIDAEDVSNATLEYNLYGESSYQLSDFIAMGSTSENNNYNEEENMKKYYHEDIGIIQEEFIFIIDFGDTNINEDKLGNTLLMELRNEDDQTLINVLGIQHASLTYNLYENQNATIDTNGNLSNNQIYVGDSVTLNLTTDFKQPIINSIQITDTTYFNNRLGAKISIYDSNNNQLNNSSLLGLTYELDGITYYPRMDGSVRIPLADKVANVLSKIKINTNNTNLNSGTYTLKIETFGSPDGIYYGYEAEDSIEVPFTVINSRYGLKITLDDNFKIIDKDTGFTLYDNNTLRFYMEYSSNLENPNVRVSLYRRNYDEIYDLNYTKVDLLDYITNTLKETGEYEYMFEENPLDNLNKTVHLKDNLQSGTYKFVFSLYDDNVYIGQCEEYVIIK